MDGLTIRRTIQARFTASQWGLQATSQGDRVARSLNASLERTVNAEDRSLPSIYGDMAEAQSRLADMGADNDVARSLVAQTVRLLYEVD